MTDTLSFPSDGELEHILGTEQDDFRVYGAQADSLMEVLEGEEYDIGLDFPGGWEWMKAVFWNARTNSAFVPGDEERWMIPLKVLGSGPMLLDEATGMWYVCDDDGEIEHSLHEVIQIILCHYSSSLTTPPVYLLATIGEAEGGPRCQLAIVAITSSMKVAQNTAIEYDIPEIVDLWVSKSDKPDIMDI